MAKEKKKLTAAQKKAKAERQKKYMWVFMNGKQVRVKRPETIEGMDVDEFIRRNSDPIWLHQNEMWEYMDLEEDDYEENELVEVNKDEDFPF
jgi:16S rRNA U516 pseudouridylate synthase RsuA-like enzyme